MRVSHLHFSAVWVALFKKYNMYPTAKKVTHTHMELSWRLFIIGKWSKRDTISGNTVVYPVPNFTKQNPLVYQSLPVSSNGIILFTALNSLLLVQFVFYSMSGCDKLMHYLSHLCILRSSVHRSVLENSLSNSLTTNVSLVLVCPVIKCVCVKVLCVTATA